MSLGMAMVSFTENQVNLEGDNVDEPESGGVSAMSANLYYKFYPMDKMSFYIDSTIPMAMLSSGDTYFNVTGGWEYYFSKGAHQYKKNQDGIKLTLTPKTRYFAFADIGVSYIAYTTETAKKNDTFFEFGGGGGFSYSLSNSWSLRATAGANMGAGVLTSPMVIKFFIGGTYFLADSKD